MEGYIARAYSQSILACEFSVSYYNQSISLTGWLDFGKGLPPRMFPYHLAKPQSTALGFFYCLSNKQSIYVVFDMFTTHYMQCLPLWITKN
jgi:hypothetical protein